MGIGARNLCEQWNQIRSLAVVGDPGDLDLLGGAVEEHQGELFSNEPVLGAPRWLVEEVVSLGDGIYAVLMHDGHVENCAIVRRQGTEVSLLMESSED
jgi:hypothetical protein